MFREYDPKDVTARLLRYIQTERYQPPDGCLKFLQMALWELGIKIEGRPGSSLRDGRQFKRVDKPSFGTVVVWRNLPWPYNDNLYHVGLMLDERYCIQSSSATNGVARLEISRYPMSMCQTTFYRPKVLD
jgi:hypothetical protein